MEYSVLEKLTLISYPYIYNILLHIVHNDVIVDQSCTYIYSYLHVQWHGG
jgi:hypothetical protein